MGKFVRWDLLDGRLAWSFKQDKMADEYPLALAGLPFWLPSIETMMIWHEKNHGTPFTRG
jgi:hypothetical protein